VNHSRLFMALALGSFALAAHAQDEPAADAPAKDALAKTSFSLTFNTDWVGSADFDTSPGDVSVTRLGAQFGVRHPVNQKLTLRFAAGVEHSLYDFSGATGLVAGTSDPYDDVTITTLTIGGEYATNETDAWFFGGFVRSAGESGATFDDTISGGALIGYQHAFSDRFTLGVGAAVGTELEGDVYIVPFPVIKWNINDRWTLASGERAGMALSYKASDAWTLGVEGGYERREYRLDDNGPLPSGVVDERRVPIAFFATFTPGPNFIITGRVGASLLNEFEFQNASGVTLVEDDTEAALGFGLDLTIRF